MPRGLRSVFWEVLLLIRTELATFLVWDASNIHVVAGDVDIPYRTGDQDIVLRVKGERPDRGVIDGGGRMNSRRTREFEVEMRTRMVLDPTDEDLQRLTSASAGHLLLEDSIIDCLEDFFPIDSEDNATTCQGLVCQQLSQPSRDKKNPQWVTSSWTVEVLYDRALDQTRVG